MITSLLVANRGEIARRITRTASAMGITTIAVYSEGDRRAPFVRDADRAVALPGRTATDTYLNIDALLLAAAESGADAVHPGYGFLSERAAFAQAVIDAGLTWVGPPPAVIDAMGDKLAAKRMMAAAGVPVLPTWEPGAPGTEFPVLVKAAAGGGGKGMRVVESAADLAESLEAARRESMGAFGDDTVFLERYVRAARHVEIQILADDHGNAIHCFERECSIQRRHQKILEESPSPALDEGLRAQMGAAALTAATAVGYRNAGTVEFVLEPSGDFWFLEVNTRLQVEHPVTEAITGLDLVREQIRVAEGHPLSVSQEDLGRDGHAIEARLYAEDPAAGFLPSTGTLLEWNPPTEPPARWDSGVETGSTVDVEFDPMLAKVVVHAATRGEAAARLALVLERARIRGVTTNRDFLVATLRHPDFLAGNTTTDFIDRTGPYGGRQPTDVELRIAALAAALHTQVRNRARARVLHTLPSGWRNSVMPPERASFGHGAQTLEVTYRLQRDGSFEAGVGEWSGRLRVEEAAPGWITLHLARARHGRHLLFDTGRVWVQGPDGDVLLTVRPRFPEAETGAGVAGGLVAPMPGKVLTVNVNAGDRVDAGTVLLILEAMKMEHRVTSPHAGVVTEVRAAAGDQVDGGDLLVVVES